jgi:hypothetical protein
MDETLAIGRLRSGGLQYKASQANSSWDRISKNTQSKKTRSWFKWESTCFASAKTWAQVQVTLFHSLVFSSKWWSPQFLLEKATTSRPHLVFQGGNLRLAAVILGAEIRRIMVRSQPWENSLWNTISKKPNTKQSSNRVAQVVECLPK